MAAESKSDLISGLFANEVKVDDRKRPATSCVQFKKQVGDLMTTLKSCRQHYIRTIKPNEDKRPGVVTKPMMMSQIQYLGLLENVTVRRAGYAHRIPYMRFLAAYKCCSSRHINIEENPAHATEALLKELGVKDYKMGKTKVFIRSPETLFKMEDKRNAFRDDANKRLPPEDQLIYADKVRGYSSKATAQKPEKTDLLLVVSAQAAYVFEGKKQLHKITMEELQGLSYGDSKDGFVILHCTQLLDEKQKAKNVQPKAWDVLIEDVYKSELNNIVEVLKQSGVQIDVRTNDIIPASVEPGYKNEATGGSGTRSAKGRCSVM